MLFFKSKKEKENEAVIKADERLRHIAFIMDGNGRWAQKRSLPREAGHAYGAEKFRTVMEWCHDIGIKTVTVYAFSTENWTRPEKEVSSIIKLLSDYVDKAVRELDEHNVRYIFLGDKNIFTKDLRERLMNLENISSEKTNTINIALNYGSRAEIVNASNELIKEGKTEITEKDIDSHLYTRFSPPPDLIVRTGGEVRLSNFLLWQAAYSELFFTKTLWPDFSKKELMEIISAFYGRVRRYGGLK